jgi:hypothetical protein
VDVRAVEAGIVIELRVGRQAEGPPVLQQRGHRCFRGNGALRPRGDQAAVAGDAGEDLDADAAPEGQPLDGVEAIEFGLAPGHVRQVPAPRGRGPPDPRAAVQAAAPLQDATDGTDRGHGRDAPRPQLAVDRRCTELAQVTGGAELVADGQHEVLHRVGAAVDRRGQAAGPIPPVDAVEPLAGGPAHPALDGAEGDAEAACDLAHRVTAADGFNDLSALLLGPAFLAMVVSWELGLPETTPCELTPECWHLADS